MVETFYRQEQDELFEKAAEIIEHSISEQLQRKEFAVLGISGGRSVPGVFSQLKNKKISWANVHIFMVDEKLLPIDDAESNFKLAKEYFIDELIKEGKLPEENVHPFILDKKSANFGIKEYEAELKKYGGSYDIVLLSSGEDGHIGAVYPNHHSIKDDSEYFIVMHDSPIPPKDRMGASKNLLLNTKTAILIFVGEIKKEAYMKFIHKKVELDSCPAKLVQQIKSAYILTDIKE